jgi:hypothetical protein
MNESIDPTDPNAATPPPTTSSSQPTYKEDTKDVKADSGETHVVMGMTMNEEQYKTYMKNLSDTLINQIKQDDAEYTKNAQRILDDQKREEGN